MSEKDFIEREGFEGFGELPEDLRGAGAISLPDGSFLPGWEMDSYSTNGGAYRTFVEPVPGALANSITFTAINYLPRANYPSFRSQMFFARGMAFVPPDPNTWVPLLVDLATLPPGSPQTYSSGKLSVPAGYAGVITGIRQWVGDSTAVQKPDGQPDDIRWKIEAGSTPIFQMGDLPMIISSLDQEGKLFAIINETTTVQLSVMNSLNPGDPFARSIGIQAMLTGYWFSMDEIDDIFRNR